MKHGWQKRMLYATIISMEGCWLYILMTLLNKQAAGGHLSVPGILFIYPLAFIFNLLLQQLHWPKIFNRSVSWLGWTVSMLLMVKFQLFGNAPLSDTAWLLSIPQSIAAVIHTFKPELLIILSTGVMWWLGQRLSYLKVSFTTLVSEFQFGLLILITTFFVSSQLKIDLTNSVPSALTFFVIALLGISIAHALEGTGWLSGLYRGHWSGLLLVSISLVLLLGLLIGVVITPDLLQLVVDAAKWGWSLIMKALIFIASLLPASEPDELPAEMPMPDIGGSSKIFNPWNMPEAVRRGLRISMTLLWIGLSLLVLWRISSQIFSWLRRKLATRAGAEFEPLPGALKADFLSILKRIIAKILGLKLTFRRRVKAETAPAEITSVRQIYRQFLHWAATGGCPRLMAQTPHEYCSTLTGLLPAVSGDLNLITQQYVRARYGVSRPTEDELDQLGQAWSRVKQNHLKQVNIKPARE